MSSHKRSLHELNSHLSSTSDNTINTHHHHAKLQKAELPTSLKGSLFDHRRARTSANDKQRASSSKAHATFKRISTVFQKKVLYQLTKRSTYVDVNIEEDDNNENIAYHLEKVSIMAIVRSSLPDIIAGIKEEELVRTFVPSDEESYSDVVFMDSFLLSLERLYRLIVLKDVILETCVSLMKLLERGIQKYSDLNDWMLMDDSLSENEPIKKTVIFKKLEDEINTFVTFVTIESRDIPSVGSRKLELMTVKELILSTYDMTSNNVKSDLFLPVKQLKKEVPLLFTGFKLLLASLSSLNLETFGEKVIINRCKMLVEIRIFNLSANCKEKSLLPIELRVNPYGTRNIFANWVFKFVLSILKKWAFVLGESITCYKKTDIDMFRKGLLESTTNRKDAYNYIANLNLEDNTGSTARSLNLERQWVRELSSYAKDVFISSKIEEIFDIIYEFSQGNEVIPILCDIRECMDIGEEFFQKVDNALFAKRAIREYEIQKQAQSSNNRNRRESLPSSYVIPLVRNALKNNDDTLDLNGETVNFSKNRWSDDSFTSYHVNNKAQSLILFRQQIVKILNETMKSRLLHAGTPSYQIINFMIAMEEALKFLDPSSNLFLQVYSTLQKYLKNNRPNSVELILEQLISQLKDGFVKSIVGSKVLDEDPRKQQLINKIVSKEEIVRNEFDIQTKLEKGKGKSTATPKKKESDIIGGRVDISFTSDDGQPIPSVGPVKYTPNGNLDDKNSLVFKLSTNKYGMKNSESTESFLEDIAFQSVLDDDGVDEDYAKLGELSGSSVIPRTPTNAKQKGMKKSGSMSGLRRGNSSMSLFDNDNDEDVEEKSFVMDTSTPLAAVSRYGSLSNLDDMGGIGSSTGKRSRRPSFSGKRLADMSFDELIDSQKPKTDKDNVFVVDHESNPSNEVFTVQSESPSGRLLNVAAPTNLTFEQVGTINIREHMADVVAEFHGHANVEDLVGGSTKKDADSLREKEAKNLQKRQNSDIYFSSWEPDPIDAVGSSEEKRFDLANRLISMIDSRILFVKTEERRLLLQLLKSLDDTKASHFASAKKSISDEVELKGPKMTITSPTRPNNAIILNRYMDPDDVNAQDVAPDSPANPMQILLGTPVSSKNIIKNIVSSGKKKDSNKFSETTDALDNIFDMMVPQLELDLLKKRLNDMDFNGCDIMVWDVTNSKKINVSWRLDLYFLIKKIRRIMNSYVIDKQGVHKSNFFSHQLKPAGTGESSSRSSLNPSQEVKQLSNKKHPEEMSLSSIFMNLSGNGNSPSSIINKFHERLSSNVNKSLSNDNKKDSEPSSPSSSQKSIDRIGGYQKTNTPSTDNFGDIQSYYKQLFDNEPVFSSFTISDVYWPLNEPQYAMLSQKTKQTTSKNKETRSFSINSATQSADMTTLHGESIAKFGVADVGPKPIKETDQNGTRVLVVSCEFRLPCHILREKKLYAEHFRRVIGKNKQRLGHLYNIGSVDLKLEVTNMENKKEIREFKNVTELNSTVIYFASLLAKFGTVKTQPNDVEIDYVEYLENNKYVNISGELPWPLGFNEHVLPGAKGKDKSLKIHDNSTKLMFATLKYYNSERLSILTKIKEWVNDGETSLLKRLPNKCYFSVEAICKILSEIPIDEPANPDEQSFDVDTKRTRNMHFIDVKILDPKIIQNELLPLVKNAFAYWEEKGILQRLPASGSNAIPLYTMRN